MAAFAPMIRDVPRGVLDRAHPDISISRVRQYATPVAPGCSMASTLLQSVTLKGTFSIFIGCSHHSGSSFREVGSGLRLKVHRAPGRFASIGIRYRRKYSLAQSTIRVHKMLSQLAPHLIFPFPAVSSVAVDRGIYYLNGRRGGCLREGKESPRSAYDRSG